MTSKIFILLLFLLIYSENYAQAKIDTGNIIYQPVSKNYFKKKFIKANFGVDYFFTDGWSDKDRYFYEILIRDSLLTIFFYSPNTDSYNRTQYLKKAILNDSEQYVLKQVTEAAQLKQIKPQIPRTTFSSYTREILSVKYQNVSIAGGMAYGNTANYPEDKPESQVNASIDQDRSQSSSIEGNYDLLISALKKLFVDLNRLEGMLLKK